ncbi:hypothetical protein KDH_72160 [Dictyobacter sp. S3.2.2.5]|uniref:HTH tetR-type domain-containing protein n=1 Tax=Dictyobacter halimunensis TaxID=3026934 RepID=A0ABQ6G2R2_9CHLR|nr:hypothetical protein KDH_72160 [Dictyobacter sp. S3.2.2.5]
MTTHKIQKRSEDRRIQRTRQGIQQAFKEIAHERGVAARGIGSLEKSFLSMSIQDITERANVNRGTFYLHFTDKYMLVETIVREQFRQTLLEALPPAPRWNRETLEALIQTVLDSCEQKYRHHPHASSILVPMIERAMHEELTDLLLTWLKQRGDTRLRGAVPPQATARIVGWSIFGAALQWSQEEEITISKVQMAQAILRLIMDGTTNHASIKEKA